MSVLSLGEIYELEKLNGTSDLIETVKYWKAVSDIQLEQFKKYREALINLADYVLVGEYKKETLKLLGLLDEDEE